MVNLKLGLRLSDNDWFLRFRLSTEQAADAHLIFNLRV